MITLLEHCLKNLKRPLEIHINSYNYNYIVGCKHRVSEGVFYIRGRGFRTFTARRTDGLKYNYNIIYYTVIYII